MSQQGAPVPSSSRRRFLHQVGIAVVGGVVSLLTAVPLAGYFLSVLTNKTPLLWVRLCSLDQVDSEQPREFRVTFPGGNSPVPYQVVQGVFVLRRGDQILAFSNVCTHMGCSVRWLEWRQQIICPCHGGMYDRWGHLMGGPPSSDLPLYLSKVEGNDLYVANRSIRRGVNREGG